jgi:UDP-N-acetylglucosamine 2-epimerase (non-hydrolysing)
MTTSRRTRKIRALAVIGTRPEVIKMAPVIGELRRRRARFSVTTVLTGQHREMVRPYLSLFGIRPDHDLAIMQRAQTLDGIVERILRRLPAVLKDVRPDIVLVQGDTTSAFAAALAAFHQQIAVGHVEAGLRTNNKYNPFPEEMSRRLIGRVADLHFAPTAFARRSLLREAVAPSNVFVTGNTVIDALQSIARRRYDFTDPVLAAIPYSRRRVICVTTHRRESFGPPMRNTLKALRRIAERYPDVEIVLPVHYNPSVRQEVYRLLSGIERIHLVEPLGYEAFVHLLKRCYLVLTDSGGVQEEAPSLGKPVLVLRETTERPEGIRAGTAMLVGTNAERIVKATATLLDNPRAYRAMAQAVNPYGDGRAAKRIAAILESRFG